MQLSIKCGLPADDVVVDIGRIDGIDTFQRHDEYISNVQCQEKSKVKVTQRPSKHLMHYATHMCEYGMTPRLFRMWALRVIGEP
jgi:hypothetical protein